MALGIALGVIVGDHAAVGQPGRASVRAWLRVAVSRHAGDPAIVAVVQPRAGVSDVIGIPGLFEVRTVDVMTPFLAALLGLGINQGAYTSEVVRAGLLSVDQGQYEAAKSIGMPRLQALRRIILPQAMRVIVPPIGNELIGMVKLTSLASVIQYAGDAAQRREHLLRECPRDRTADRRGHLVSGHCDGAVVAAVAGRTRFRTRRGTFSPRRVMTAKPATMNPIVQGGRRAQVLSASFEALQRHQARCRDAAKCCA